VLIRPLLTQFLEYRWGLLDYAAVALSQMNYCNWLGALVFTALGALFWPGTWRVMAQVTGADSRAASFGTPFPLLLLRERYDCPVLAMGTGLLAAIAPAFGCFRLFRLPSATPSTPNPPSKAKVRDSSPDLRCAPRRAWLRLCTCWIVFSRKQLDSLFDWLFFSYVDEHGRFYKPFLLPQRDPAFYESYFNTFNVPELIWGPITVNENELPQGVLKPLKLLAPKTTGQQALQAPPAGQGDEGQSMDRDIRE